MYKEILWRLNVDLQERCIDTIAPKLDWILRIDEKNINLNYLKDELFMSKHPKRKYVPTHTNSNLDPLLKDFIDFVIEDPLKHYPEIEKQCLIIPLLMKVFAVLLPARTVEKLSWKIFSKDNVDTRVAESYYTYFIPNYLKRIYSWFSLHLLVKASKAYPDLFKNTFKVILMDHFPTNILIDYVNTLDTKHKTELITIVTEVQFDDVHFKHMLPVIYNLYIDCEKNENILYGMFEYVQNFHVAYTHDRNFGKLLLYMIQSLRGLILNIQTLKKFVELHATPYKGPCLAALEQYAEQLAAMRRLPMEPQQVQPRILKPRFSEGAQL